MFSEESLLRKISVKLRADFGLVGWVGMAPPPYDDVRLARVTAIALHISP